MGYGLYRVRGSLCRKKNGRFAKCRGRLTRKTRRRRR